MAKIKDSIKLSSIEIDELMRRENRLRIATIGPSLDINLTPMTFGWANGLVYIYGRGQKIANLRRNPTTTILIDIGSSWKDLQGIMMRGTSRVLETLEEEKLDPWLQIARINLGKKSGIERDGEIQPYSASVSGNSRRWIVFEPSKIVSWDNAKLE